MQKRRWKSWPKKTLDELNSVSGFLGLGGVLLGSAGAALASPVVLIIGCFIASVALLYAGARTFPEKLISPEELIGQRLSSISALDNLTTRIPRIGIVGPSNTGKSTLVEKLLRSAGVPDPTASVYIVILRSGGENQKIFALLDGAGEEYPQQFAVSKSSDILFMILDHNENEIDATIKQSRLDDHKSFMRQLIAYLKGEPIAGNVYVLLNKCDNWKRSKNSDEFKSWGEEIKSDLASVVEGNRIIVREHCNWEVDFINRFWSEVEEAVK